MADAHPVHMDNSPCAIPRDDETESTEEADLTSNSRSGSPEEHCAHFVNPPTIIKESIS